jgi:hypothetical protein
VAKNQSYIIPVQPELILDQVVQNHQVYIIKRRDGENVALIAE